MAEVSSQERIQKDKKAQPWMKSCSLPGSKGSNAKEENINED